MFGLSLAVIGCRSTALTNAEDTLLEILDNAHTFRGGVRAELWILQKTLDNAAKYGGGQPDISNVYDPVLAKFLELDEASRIVLFLADVMGLSDQSIGDLIGLNSGTVKSRRHRARTQTTAHDAG